LQWWEYFLAGTYYFIGWVFFILMLAPVSYLLFNVPSYFALSQVYLSLFLPFFVLSMFLFYKVMLARHYKAKYIYIGTILGFICFPILIKSTMYGLFGKKMPFVITTKGKSEKLPLIKLWPYIFMLLLFTTSIVVGFLDIRNSDRTYSIIINSFWVLYHSFILSFIFYLNKEPDLSYYEKE
jgi:cellulose synthase (UDP-forming)